MRSSESHAPLAIESSHEETGGKIVKMHNMLFLSLSFSEINKKCQKY
jgi:hypothetical protein